MDYRDRSFAFHRIFHKVLPTASVMILLTHAIVRMSANVCNCLILAFVAPTIEKYSSIECSMHHRVIALASQGLLKKHRVMRSIERTRFTVSV